MRNICTKLSVINNAIDHFILKYGNLQREALFLMHIITVVGFNLSLTKTRFCCFLASKHEITLKKQGLTFSSVYTFLSLFQTNKFPEIPS